jgi:hypothetical protein
MKTLIRLMLLGVVFAIGAAMASADMPGQHPTYMHGLSDLRAARAHLDFHNPNERRDAEEDHAIHEIDAAIDAAQRAAAKDGKDLKQSEPIDVHLPRADRYVKAHDLLDSARRNIAAKEDNPHARDNQNEAVGHIDAAMHIVGDLQRKYH